MRHGEGRLHGTTVVVTTHYDGAHLGVRSNTT
jgi:hypothetical protein